MKTNARNMLENDPRLTAYALGDLAGDDAAAVEAMLADSPAALAEVEAIRGTAASIRGALGGAAGLTLSDAGRAAILESAATASARAGIIRHPLLRWGTTLTAAAASLALAATMWRMPSVTPTEISHGKSAPSIPDPVVDERILIARYGDFELRELGVIVRPGESEAYLIEGRAKSAMPQANPADSPSVAFDVKPGVVVGQVVDKSAARPGAPIATGSSYGGAGSMAMVQNSTAVTSGADAAGFGRDTTHFTFDLWDNLSDADWTGSEVAVDVASADSIWKAGDQVSLGQSVHLHRNIEEAYRKGGDVPSSGDTDADRREAPRVLTQLGYVGNETILSTGDDEDVAFIEQMLRKLDDSDGNGVPWQQDVLARTDWYETPSSAPVAAIRDELRSDFAKEVASKDVASLEAAARELYDAQRFGDAEQVTRLALEIDPGNEDLQRMQLSCVTQVDSERMEQRRAILHRQRAEKINELFKRAETCRRSGDFDGASTAVQQVSLLDPQNPSIVTTLAQIQQEDRASRDNPFLESLCRPLSTFSIDVDTAAYSLVRQTLAAGQLPSPESVRIEELINYFDYDYPPPTDDHPFAANLEIAACPWQPAHRLVRVGLKGQVVQAEQRPVANLVFLIDVSGSMNEPAKLPMVKNSLRMLVDQLFDDDRVALVVYAGAAGLVLPSTPASQRDAILAAIDNLSAGGSTDGGSGIALAYDVAAQNFLNEGINRVVLATDGDFNVGISDRGQLETLITERAKTGVFLTTLGYGYGNVNDKTLETLADKGNGHYAIIDSLDEAKRVLVDNVGGTLQAIAKDVKIQVEFNPATVAGYRLIGYENRILAARDFNDDTKDAGEIGAGHTVTALYEVVPVGVAVPPMSEAAFAKLPPEDSLRSVLADEGVDPLKYQTPGEWMRAILPPVETKEAESDDDASHRIHADDGVPPSAWHPPVTTTATDATAPEIMTLKLRYKLPDGDVSSKIEFAVADRDSPFDAASDDFRFASAVAAYGMLLRNSIYAGEINMASVAEIAGGALGIDESGRRAEFVELARRAGELLAVRAAAE